MGLVERREEILKLLISRRKSTVPILMHEFHVSEKRFAGTYEHSC